ncbi:MAG: ArnT family glycosyltransferase [Anaerolineae bacterium]
MRLAGLIFLLAAVLRLAWPTLTEFKFSEARLEALALEWTREGRLPLVGVPSSAGVDHSPLSVYLYIPAFLLTTHPIPATLYGGLISLAAVVLSAWLAWRWPGGGTKAALWTELLFAISPWAVAFSRKIWQVVFIAPLVLVCVMCVIAALIQKRPWALTWACFTYGLLVQVHPSAIALALAFGLWLLVFWRQVRVAPLLVGMGLAVLSAAPFVFYQLRTGWPALRALQALPEATWDLSALTLAWNIVTGRNIHALAGAGLPFLTFIPQLELTFNLVGWLVVASSLWLLAQIPRRWGSLDITQKQAARVDTVLLSWLLVPILFNLRHGLELHLHFFVLILPAAYLIVGRAVESLAGWIESWRQSKGKIRSALGCSLASGGCLMLGLLTISQVGTLVRMAQFVALYDTPGGFGMPLGRYLGIARQALDLMAEANVSELLVVGEGDSPVVHESPAIFDVLLRGRTMYRFVNGPTTAVFPMQRAAVLLTAQAGQATDWYSRSGLLHYLDRKGEYRLILLDGSYPDESFQIVTGPRLFKNGIEAQGYLVKEETVLDKQVVVWILWQVLWLDAEETHFSVRLLDNQGQLVGQQDLVGYPHASRRKGDRVISRFDITVFGDHGAQPCWLQVIQYQYPKMVDLPLIDGSGNPVASALLLGPVRLEP